MMTLIKDFYGWRFLEYVWLIFSVSFIFLMSLILPSNTVLGIVSAIANILCVVLVAKGRISNFFWGILGVVCYGYLAYQQRYYGNMLLNWCYYLPLQFVGFYLWYKHIDKQKEAVNKNYLSWKARILFGFIIAALSLIFSYFLARYHDGMPFPDALTTLLSLFGMLLMVNRFAEQWFVWISSNFISVYMWWVPLLQHQPGAAATFAMWTIFLINSFYGCYAWLNNSQKREYAV